MSVKTDILNSIEQMLINLNIFKTVKRGVVSIEDIKKFDYPAIRYNSFKIERNEVLSCFTRQARTMYVQYVVYNKINKSSDYFLKQDELEDEIIKFFECLLPSDVHPNVLDIDYIKAEAKINDDYIDGLYVLDILVKIDYKV